MHTLERLNQALQIAEQLGYSIRHECLDGSGGGTCEFGGRKWLFVDSSLNSHEQLALVCEALQADPAMRQLKTDSAPLQRRRAA